MLARRPVDAPRRLHVLEGFDELVEPIQVQAVVRVSIVSLHLARAAKVVLTIHIYLLAAASKGFIWQGIMSVGVKSQIWDFELK